jgi:pimeloyl-ACP methyl ester carboxylesterase
MRPAVDPKTTIRAAWQRAGLLVDLRRGRRLAVRTEDGFRLRAQVDRAEGSKTCLVLCHGITSDSREDGMFTGLAAAAAERGISAVRFDSRGHGLSAGSAGDYSLAGQRRDLAAVLAAVEHHGLGAPLPAAMSFGAAAAVADAGANRRPALVLLSPVVDYAATVVGSETPWTRELLDSRGDPRLPAWAFARAPGSGFLISKGLAAECEADGTPAALATLETPTLVFATPDDDVVPFRPTAEAAERSSRIELRGIPGEDHGLNGSIPRVIAETLDWIGANAP